MTKVVRNKIRLITLLVVCVAMCCFVTAGIAAAAEDVQITREIDGSAYAGETINVEVHVHPYITDIRGFVYTENVPAGWVISNTSVVGVNNPAQVVSDEESGGYLYPNMKPYAWVFEKPLVYPEDNPVNGDVIITYSLDVPASAEGSYSIKGFAMWNLGFLQSPVSSTITIISPTFVFDTGPGTYPSIMGTHNGTITPSNDITVKALYTYPCAGTGGHTEYVRIYNDTKTIAEEYWGGYQSGDYHNITFSQPFTLIGGQIYNYTIKTGSYPQIIHTDEWEAEGGMGIINCTSFVDANGKRYNNWIPAIRLWAR